MSSFLIPNGSPPVVMTNPLSSLKSFTNCSSVLDSPVNRANTFTNSAFCANCFLRNSIRCFSDSLNSSVGSVRYVSNADEIDGDDSVVSVATSDVVNIVRRVADCVVSVSSLMAERAVRIGTDDPVYDGANATAEGAEDARKATNTNRKDFIMVEFVPL